ncbi:MAG: putative Holliday junction resolvase YqgF [Myxococcaceae bacterium]|nr:putative Holliday junction resolvase YqgF [Myxococcaceae bacterium]
MRKMGIDPGMKRVGLALSDDDASFASPYKTLERKSDAALLEALGEEVRAQQVDEIVLGLPVRMNGLEGPEAKRARKLRSDLKKVTGIKVTLWDERMTTVAAERELRSSGLRGDKKKAMIDQAAATLLLQSFLDARRYAG